MATGADPFGPIAPPSQQTSRVHNITVPFQTLDGIKYVQIPYSGDAASRAFIAQLNDNSDFVPGTVFPTTPAPGQVAPAPGALDEYYSILGQPSTRPNEPVTQGAPGGAGSSILRVAGEEESHFRYRVSQSLMKSPAANGDVRDFVARYLGGG